MEQNISYDDNQVYGIELFIRRQPSLRKQNFSYDDNQVYENS